MVPVSKETLVGHLKNSTDVAGFMLIQESVGIRSVGIFPIHASQKSKGRQRIEKIARRPRMQTQPSTKCLEILWLLREFGEYFHFHCTQQSLRGPKSEAHLHDVIRS